jgi:membrane-bound serine protease (ClpP class)
VRLPRLLLLVLALAAGCSTQGGPDVPRVEIIKISGLLDDRTLVFLDRAIESAAEAGREVAIVQINSPGVIGSFTKLNETTKLIADPPLPLVMWLGPAPARIGGGSAQLYASAPYRAAAPGTRIENWEPAVAGVGGDLRSSPPGWVEEAEITEPVEDLVDLVVPSIGQLVQEIDGLGVNVRGEPVNLTTLTAVNDPNSDGAVEGLTTIPVRLSQPGLWDRFLRLAARPEATFFFLVAGLTVAVFEMYAVGPGLAAIVAAISLLLSAYGISVLPVRWWAVGTATAAIAILAASVQKGGMMALTLLGSALLAWSGFNFTNAAPQVVPGPAGVTFSILAVLFFFLLAIPTVARARFSTQTIGREGLIGRSGRALTRFGPDGLVEIGGARWPATAHREARIEQGSEVVVIAVDGWRVEVDPQHTPVREN